MEIEKHYEWVCRRLAFHEGCELKPYRCPSGKLTIGVGRNVEDNPFTAEELKVIGDWQKGITKNAAYMLLRNDVKKCNEQLIKNVPIYTKLDLERQYALLDMCFQLGINGLLNFKKMLKFLSMRLYRQAADECLDSRYAIQTPKRAKRIAREIREGYWSREL